MLLIESGTIHNAHPIAKLKIVAAEVDWRVFFLWNVIANRIVDNGIRVLFDGSELSGSFCSAFLGQIMQVQKHNPNGSSTYARWLLERYLWFVRIESCILVRVPARNHARLRFLWTRSSRRSSTLYVAILSSQSDDFLYSSQSFTLVKV
jgi:hypothetical protein